MSDLDPELLNDLLEWSDPQRVRVGSSGEYKMLRVSDELGKDFWKLWREWKDEIKAMGISVSRNDSDVFVAKWWSEDEGEHYERSARAPLPPTIIHSVLPGRHDLDHGSDVLRPYQIPAVATCWAAILHHGFSLDASDTGLGKTYIACALAKNLGLNVGVVCPATVQTKWMDTLMDVFGIEPEFVSSYERMRTKSNDYVTRHDTIRRGKDFTFYKWNTCDKVLIIFDEIHRCAGLGSLNSELLHAAIMDPNIYVHGMSATVALTPLTMKEIGFALGLHRCSDWWDWCQRNGCRPGPFGGLTFSSKTGSRGELALRSIHGSIFPSRGCRLRRSELASSLPKNEILVEMVDCEEYSSSPSVKKYLQAIASKSSQDVLNAMENNQEVSSLTLNTRARQESEILKVPAMFERASDMAAEGYSPVVFLNYAGSIEFFEELLNADKLKYRKLIGGMSKKQRDLQVGDFQANKVPFFLAQMDAGSEGIDLHDLLGGHPRVSLISPNYNARMLIQAFGRIPRDGSKSDCIQYVYFSTSKVEKRAAKIVQSKLNNISLINDGDLSGAAKVL